MRKVPVQLWVWSAVSAVLQLLPFPLPGPVPEWRRFFCWICLVPFFYALGGFQRDGKALGLKQTAALGYLCGVIWYGGNCYWIYQTMYLYGGLPKIVALGILFLFALYLGLYHALFGWVFGWLRLRYSKQTALLLSPFLWVAVELARSRVTGFPWDLLGYTQVDNLVLTRMVPWSGVMGLSLLVAAANALVFFLFRRRGTSRYPLLLYVAFFVIFLGYREVGRRLPAGLPGSHRAVLLQDNLSVGAELVGPREGHDTLLPSLSELSLHPKQGATGAKPDMILWPEAPADFYDADPVYRAALGQVAKTANAPVMVDAIGMDRPQAAGELPKIYNSASFFAPDGSYAGRYSKMHLVPFGEYVPYKDVFFFAGHLLDNVGQFTPGTQRNLFEVNGHKIGIFICYESIFGDEMRELAKSGADVMVNLSDDGWYGDTSAPFEHLDMVRMRAIENDRWILRATNTGVTTVIDPYGRVGATLPRHVRSSMEVGFDYVTGTTFYTRHGDWVAWLCTAVVLGFVGLGAGRKPGAPETVQSKQS
jgi:apolipoprotein N-acyltransferase